MLKPLDQNEFDRVFEIMEISFPRDERRPYDEQRALLDVEDFRILTYGEDSPYAFMAVWELDDFTFLEHFATHPDHRNHGLGEKMLKELISLSNKPICLEVEPPANEISHRRIGFYERCGLYLNLYPYTQPSISNGRSPVPLMIMTSGSQISESTFNKLRSNLYRKVYKVE
jgi:ribosomal protein S18 acetylase RimI-like enzyme